MAIFRRSSYNPGHSHDKGCQMIPLRKGDQIAITGLVQDVNGDFAMVAIDGAIDATVPTYVSTARVSLVRASVHEGDEVEDGMTMVSAIPGTSMVLLRRIDGDPDDPTTFVAAKRSELTLIRIAGSSDAVPAPVDVTTSPTRAPETGMVVDAAPSSPARVPEAVAAPATPARTDDDGAVAQKASGTDPDATTSADTVTSADDPDADGSIGGAKTRPMPAPVRSIADLGRVREEQSPLKPSDDVLVLDQPIDEPRGG